MKKKILIATLALGMIIFLGAQPQMPYLQGMDGPYCAGSFDYNGIINIADSYYDPIEPPILYAVIRDTSLVKSTNQGVLWEILPKGHLYQEKIKCVAAHPTTSDIVYKGVTGNKYQTGVMKSTNGGNNWFNLINGLPNEVRPSKLGIFPRPGYYNYLLLGMSLAQQSCGGYSLYRTTNGGSDWSFVDAWGSDFLNITDFSFHPDPLLARIVCLSANQSSDPGNAYRGIWKSTDFGVTWSHIGRPDNMEHSEITCVAMVDENIIYAGYWTGITEQAIGGVERTTDGGHKWQVLPIILDNDLIDIYIDSNEANIFYLVINSDKGIEILKYDISNFLKRDKKIIIKK